MTNFLKIKNILFNNDNYFLIKLMHALAIFFITLSFELPAFQDDQVTYMPFTLARYDNSLFSTDYNVTTMSKGFTSQFGIDILFIVFMKLGFSWIYVNVILYTLFLFIFSFGIVQIVHTIIDKYRFCIEVFFSLCIQLLLVGNAFGMNSIWLDAFFNQTPAIAFSIWGLYYALQKEPRWLAASVMISIAGFFHVQVSLFMYIVIFVLMFLSIIQTGKYKIFLTVLPVLFIAAVSFILISNGGDFSLSNEKFTSIYSVLRHPHHLLPSKWSKHEMLYFVYYALSLILFGLICTESDNRKYFIKKFILPTCILYILAILCIIINYIFVEVIPWSFVSKIYPERFFLALRFWLIIYFCYCVFLLLEKKQFVCILFLLTTIITKNNLIYMSLIFVSLVMIIQKIIKNRLKIDSETILQISNIIFTFGCLSIIFFLPSVWNNMTLKSYYQLSVFPIAMVISLLPQKTYIKKAACVLFSVLIIVASIPRNGYPFKRIYPGNPLSDDFLSFCENVKEVMPKEAIFLSDPKSAIADRVRLFSERTHIVSWKTVPTNDKPLMEYLNRLIAIGYVYENSGKYLTNSNVFSETSAEELINYAKRYSADFIFIENDIDLERFIQTQKVKINISVNNLHLLEIIEN